MCSYDEVFAITQVVIIESMSSISDDCGAKTPESIQKNHDVFLQIYQSTMFVVRASIPNQTTTPKTPAVVQLPHHSMPTPEVPFALPPWSNND